MSTTYKAVVVTKPGEFLIVEKSLSDPKPGHVRVRVEACGMSFGLRYSGGRVFD